MTKNKETRSALFTVRDGEDALIRLIFIFYSILGGIILHERILEGRTWSAAFSVMLEHGGEALTWATSLTLTIEGVMIMFSRLQDHRDRRKRRFEEARAEGITQGITQGRAEGKAEGITQGRAEGITQGRAEGKAEGITQGRAEGKTEIYKEIAEWNNRRLAAQARNEPFTEPLPEPPDTTH